MNQGEEASGSRQMERDVHDATLALRGHCESGFFEHTQHRGVARQHFGDQLPQSTVTCDRGEMLHQQPTESASLMRVVYSESDFRDARRDDDVTAAADDERTLVAMQHRHQRDVVYEIDIQIELDLSLAEMPLRCEETPVDRLVAHAVDRALQLIAIGGPQSTDLDAAAVAQRFRDCVTACVHRASVVNRQRESRAYGVRSSALRW